MKKIIHIDMDAFYASIEQRDNPSLKGKPVIVGGYPKSRSVVATCSYEARKFGIHSAMPTSMAYKKCPDAIFLKPRMDRYKEISQEILQIFHTFTEKVEPLSLDEAYLDVSDNTSYATQIAKEIKKEIVKKTSLTASAGVSFNKFLAKIASGYKKPNGLTIITPDKADAFMEKLSIHEFYGIGKVTEKLLRQNGICTGADLKKLSKMDLLLLLGKRGEYYYNIIRKKGDTEVNPCHVRKSLGREITLSQDIEDKKVWIQFLEEIADDLEKSLLNHQLLGKTITLKITFFDFKKVTRSLSKPYPITTKTLMIDCIKLLLDKVETKKARLLGISLSNFVKESPSTEIQLSLF